MNPVLKSSKLVIFDLDGTLYEGTDHFDYYANHLKQNVPQSQQLDFWRDYTAMKDGHHPVQIGKGYDVKRDYILTIDPMTISVQSVQTWDGSYVPVEEWETLYSDPVSFDFETIIAVGDGWWYPFVTAKHYGVEDCYASYVATKEYMVTDEFELTPLPGLREGLIELKATKEIVLVTNSDREDVQRLLHELHLHDVFNHIITSAKKPTRTTDIFKEVVHQYEVDMSQVVSVGDNFMNEIAQALTLGMQGIYIHPQRASEVAHDHLTVIRSVVELFKN
ncbi:HAD family hydrolase [Halalkalibacterium halodurans]|uniref:HAD family hydrolase n=1 Tax=Halalkalibacterium halodurans TaxID=86665 RepID=UPI002AA98952|nr:HAD family hydrolase [Halalkalibacterium halodurans]MDY7223519.1 HAD family hydrolase [Halalkalibacterium halodurans]MDY7242740.1 HAD family hydrolase [Halalkalibacterium halodurans]MED3646540.1 HAD family hydrolase [Halalkalibacterium halodurans]